jgi:hypothetical protein
VAANLSNAVVNSGMMEQTLAGVKRFTGSGAHIRQQNLGSQRFSEVVDPRRHLW